jgi:putative glutathione S-transferase
MIEGELIDTDATTGDAAGRYKRTRTNFHNWITADGSAGPTGGGGFAAETDRYHLYVAINCPWAHRARIFRLLKKLEGLVSMSITLPRRNEYGWVFDNDSDTYADPLLGAGALHEVYTAAQPAYTGPLTVPVLWDKRRATIVSTESADIIRMFDTGFAAIAEPSPDYYPAPLRADIDALNERIYRTVNNGVYRAGFASKQGAYEEAVTDVFDTLDFLDQRLSTRRYLCGDDQTEADWRLFPTLARFDVAYHGAFRCNVRRLIDYENLWRYARELYAVPGIAETVDFDIYRRGYYSPSAKRNPFGIVPIGPAIDWS